jgi:hypothetical protein
LLSEAKLEQVIKGCQKGNRGAQETLYKAMASLCLRYTGNEEVAAEVLNR